MYSPHKFTVMREAFQFLDIIMPRTDIKGKIVRNAIIIKKLRI